METEQKTETEQEKTGWLDLLLFWVMVLLIFALFFQLQ